MVTRRHCVDGLILLLTNTRHKRDFLRAHGVELDERFPVRGRRALELLAAGLHPGGRSIILLYEW